AKAGRASWGPARSPRRLPRIVDRPARPEHAPTESLSLKAATPPGGVALRKRAFSQQAYLNSSLLTVTIFLPSFSDVVPVTSPSLASLQILLWYFLPALSSK